MLRRKLSFKKNDYLCIQEKRFFDLRQNEKNTEFRSFPNR